MSWHAMSLAEIRTQTLLCLEDPDGDRYTTPRLDQAIHEALLDLVLLAELTVETIPVTLLAGVFAYDLHEAARLAGTSDPLAVLRVGMADAEGRTLPALHPTTLSFLDLSGQPRTLPGQPLRWYRDGLPPDLLGVWRVPDRDGLGSLQVQALCYPRILTQASDTPQAEVLPLMQEALPLGAAALLLLESQSPMDLRAALELDEAFHIRASKAAADRSAPVSPAYNPFRPR